MKQPALAGKEISSETREGTLKEAREIEEDLRITINQLRLSNAELNLFASTVSHELQEPVRKIIAFGDMIDAKDIKDPATKKIIERMQAAAVRMQRLVNGLLEMSRVVRRTRPVDLVDLAIVLRDVAAEFQGRVEKDGGSIKIGPMPTVRGDELQLRQVFENLFSNAFKFRKKEEPPYIGVTNVNPRAGFMEICVTDSGIGFDQREARRIFRPFQRLHRRAEYEGSGLGLAICERIARRHGGEIKAESAPGEGSTFTLTLPV